MDEELVKALEKFALPLFAIDDATLHLVSASSSEVHLHVGGAYAGCPGVDFVVRGLLAPLVSSVLPSAEITVESGFTVPEGARLLRVPESGSSTSI